jgi:hypothetical protein
MRRSSSAKAVSMAALDMIELSGNPQLAIGRGAGGRYVHGL